MVRESPRQACVKANEREERKGNERRAVCEERPGSRGVLGVASRRANEGGTMLDLAGETLNRPARR